MATCFRCGATYPDLTVHHCGTGAAMYVQVPGYYAEGYKAGGSPRCARRASGRVAPARSRAIHAGRHLRRAARRTGARPARCT